MAATVVLRAEGSAAEIAIDAGGRVAQILVGDQPLLIERGHDPASTGWGAYPMAPWAGRIRHGVLHFAGGDHRLATNHQDGADDDPARRHAIHGTVFGRPWTVQERTDRTIRMTCPLGGALDWPFGGTADHRIEITPSGLRCELSVEAGDRPFPAEVGWHPWFAKPERLEFRPTAMYRRDDLGLPTGELTDPTPGPWDDCFVNTEPVTLHYARPVAAAVTVESDCDHWVVYDEPSLATCVEPQSGPPDAANIAPRVLGPGERLRRTMTVGW